MEYPDLRESRSMNSYKVFINHLKIKKMKKLPMLCAVVCVLACSQQEKSEVLHDGSDLKGSLVVSVSHKCDVTKSGTGYTEVLDVEKEEKKVSVFVFDKATGVLNASKNIGNTAEECEFSIPVGEKTVWAVVNGPELSGVVSMEEFEKVVDDLSLSSLQQDGLAMIGSEDCIVEAGATVTPVIVVSRMVSRVVLRNVVCRVPEQYGKLRIDCVYLGNAFTRQTFAGDVSGKVNVEGYNDQEAPAPIGKDGIIGSCPEYLYASVGTDVNVSETAGINRALYCHPNDTPEYTDLFIIATVGERQYYYKVPLNQGLEMNTSYTVDVVIMNLGEAEPPVHDHDKGRVEAVITVADWVTGDDYSAEI